jgi:hypothetical protein
MAWIIGSVVIIIAVLYWRVSWPLGIVAVIIIGSLAWYAHYDSGKTAHEQEISQRALAQKIRQALENASPEGKEWRVEYVEDPASAQRIGRNASIVSNDGLCRFVVGKRLDGREQAGLQCPDFKKYNDKDMEIRFDGAASSDYIDIGKFNDDSGIYISPYLFVSPGHIAYKAFINHLKVGHSLALKIPAEHGVWVTFTLEGGADALSKLGKPLVPSVPGG